MIAEDGLKSVEVSFGDLNESVEKPIVLEASLKPSVGE